MNQSEGLIFKGLWFNMWFTMSNTYENCHWYQQQESLQNLGFLNSLKTFTPILKSTVYVKGIVGHSQNCLVTSCFSIERKGGLRWEFLFSVSVGARDNLL